METVSVEDYEEEYRDMLDELSTVEIGGLTYSGARTLEAIDPVAYRCGLNDFADSRAQDDGVELD